MPYASLYQLVRPALGALERIPRAQAAALESALGLREDTAPDLYRVPLAVLTLLAEVAEEGPLLCIIDDAQWIDHDSEQALVFAARRLHAEGVAMLFAAREGECQPGALPELLLQPLDAGVRFRPALAGADGRTVQFADGTSLDVETVIWATGYRPDYSWIRTPGVTRGGQVIHRRGVTDVPGLYFVGLSWQHTRGSALLGFVNDDAAFLAGHIAARHRTGDLPSPHIQAGRQAQGVTRSQSG